jgi:hypothetical protein
MLLKPLSTNAFYASLAVGVGIITTIGISGPVFRPLFETPGMQDFLRTVVVPLIGG